MNRKLDMMLTFRGVTPEEVAENARQGLEYGAAHHALTVFADSEIFKISDGRYCQCIAVSMGESID